MSAKLTPWFQPGVNPEHVGPYQACHSECECRWNQQGYQYWDGKQWGAYNFSPKEAECEKHVRSMWQKCYWRGLASDQKASNT
jgi:hypothetical protein